MNDFINELNNNKMIKHWTLKIYTQKQQVNKWNENKPFQMQKNRSSCCCNSTMKTKEKKMQMNAKTETE